MDDTVCPLCCEELDISDREFYPCKCGYQVCMWCWHRIRESESGLCPACRTPYGEDPHAFTAVDVQQVLKQNKQKEAAAKRERQHQHTDSDGTGTVLEVPKDRTQLANMRVIRRNLVYAVGLPPNIANEDVLRKPDYFGQYGKISKIVLNRSQATSADTRRASASAYVTFCHKEDTLACILALDGMFLENRNIRASYGTSKYCSAFIKNVRCNNPECTYLHEMGAPEDTFTKQEIQAGYVTSGRDVLARQQQIVEEQLRQVGGGGGAPLKKVIGNGGPSGTGRASNHPVFPPPEFDEPIKQQAPPPQSGPPLIPPPAGVNRSMTTGTGMAPLVAATGGSKVAHGRSASLGTKIPAQSAAATAAARRASAATAASVVAGVHSVSHKAEPDPHTTLTPLTPLKRASKSSKATAMSSTSSVSSVVTDEGKAEPTVRSGKRQNGRNSSSGSNSTKATSAATVSSSASMNEEQSIGGSSIGGSSIGGVVIGPSRKTRTNVIPGMENDASPTSAGLSALGGQPIDMNSVGGHSLSSSLGGEVYTGQLPSSSAIGGGGSKADKWNSSAIGGATLSTGPMLGGNVNTGLWDSGGRSNSGLAPGPAGGGGGGGSVIGSHISSPNPADSSSALASILGINLPTGSGSLQESTNLWPSQAPPGPSALSALNGSSVPSQGNIGPGPSPPGSSLIGGVPIGGGSSALNPPGPPQGGKNDIALLQSLLPGVHVTSGNDAFGYGGGGNAGGSAVGWGQAPVGPSPHRSFGGGVNGNTLGGSWSGGTGMPPTNMQPSSMGAVGQSGSQQEQRRQGPGIW